MHISLGLFAKTISVMQNDPHHSVTELSWVHSDPTEQTYADVGCSERVGS